MKCSSNDRAYSTPCTMLELPVEIVLLIVTFALLECCDGDKFDPRVYFKIAATFNMTHLYFHKFYCASSIKLPESLTSLASNCFYGSVTPANITLPESLTSLGNYCFSGCSKLASITLPQSLTSIGHNCFSDCSALVSITLPPSLTSLGHFCFLNCSALVRITFPPSLTSLGNGCFEGCSALAQDRKTRDDTASVAAQSL